MTRCSGSSLLDSQTKQDDGPENAPPAGDRPHLCVTFFTRWIDFRDRHLDVPISELKSLEHEVRLQLILVEPVLLPRDAGITQNRGSKSPETIGGFGQLLSGNQRKQQRMHVTSANDAV